MYILCKMAFTGMHTIQIKMLLQEILQEFPIKGPFLLHSCKILQYLVEYCKRLAGILLPCKIPATSHIARMQEKNFSCKSIFIGILTGQKRNDQPILAMHVYWMAAWLSIKHLFICCSYSNLWLALEWHIHMLWLTPDGPFMCLMYYWFAFKWLSAI